MKKIIALILCVLSIVYIVPLSVSSSSFTDVPDGKWYSEGIEFCYQNGYMAGVSEGVFDRNGNLTRAMFVTILAGLDKADTSKHANASHFTDVAAGKWYSGAVNWAFENGLASGIGEGTFGYKNPVTREQIAVFMLAYAEFSNATHPERNPFDISAKADLSGYDDAARIHGWAFDALSWAVASGLISGTSDTTLDPRGFCTRAQAAVIIHSFMRDIEKKECEHVWVAPDCTNDGYCSVCNEKGEAALGHIWVDPDCENDGYCSRCNEKGEAALGHIWVTPDCENDGYCSVCNEKGEAALGHVWVDPDCENDGYCSRCNEKGEAALGHVWVDPDCENDGYCSRCNEKGENSPGHVWVAPDCLSDGYCSVCGEKSGSAVGHDWIAPDCENDGYCSRCNEKGESALGHVWISPDCENDGYCSRCNEKGENALGHNYLIDEDDTQFKTCEYCGDMTCATEHRWIDATCTKDGYCALCKDFYESATGHKVDEYDTCIRCGGEYDPIAGCFHEWILPDCYNDGYCTVCGMKGEISDGHEFENGECLGCGMKLCRHKWADATCTKPIHCSLCGEEDPESEPLGHRFVGTMMACIRCRMIDNPSYTPYINLVANIQYNGSGYDSFSRALINADGGFETALAMNFGTAPIYVINNGSDAEGRTIDIRMEMNENSESYTFTFEAVTDGKSITASGVILKDRSIEISSLNCGEADSNEAKALTEREASRLIDSFELALRRYTNLTLSDFGFAK